MPRGDFPSSRLAGIASACDLGGPPRAVSFTRHAGVRWADAAPYSLATMPRALFLAFLLSFTTLVSNAFARFAYALVLPAMRSDLGWNWSQSGLLNTWSSAGYLAGAVLARLLVARLGNRRLYQAGIVLTAVAILATGMTRSFEMLALARFVAGAGGAAAFVCGAALSGNVMPERPAMSTTFITVYGCGAGLGMMFSGVLIPPMLDASVHAWQSVWMAMGWASLLMAAAAVWASTQILEPGAAAGGARWEVLPVLPQLGGYLMFAVGYIGYMTFVIAWMRDNGASTSSVAKMWTVLGFATLVGPLMWRGPLQRWPGGRPMAAALGLLTIGALIPLLRADFGWMLASALLFGAGMFSVPSSVTALVTRALPKPAWGSALATFTIVFGAGQVIGPVATGWLADLTGSLRPGLAASVAVLALGALIALAQRDVAVRASPAAVRGG